jgi:hypothetical protein
MTVTNRKFGIELEVRYSGGLRGLYQTVAGAATRGVCDPHGYDHDDREHGDYYSRWLMHSECGGYEVKCPPSTFAANEPELRAVMNAIRTTGGSRDENLGTHVHIDTADLTAQERLRYVALFWAVEDGLFHLVKSYRRDNEWVAPIRDQLSWSDFRDLLLSPTRRCNWVFERLYRYALSPQTDYGTSEIRLHHCTMNPDSIFNWLRLNMALIAYSQSVTTFSAYDRLAGLDRADQIRAIRDIASEMLEGDERTAVVNSIAYRADRFGRITL